MTPARAFCEAYDAWQTLYARYRLQGWSPVQQPPKDLEASYRRFLESIDELRTAELGGPRPNYTAIAQLELARIRP